jgi:sugar/nucleoside kinase (ribokinase family)
VSRALDVVHLGAASRDLSDDDPRGWRLGGGVTYAALTTARLGLATAAAIGLDGLARTAWELDLLRDAGVEILPLDLAEGPVFANEERPGGRVQVAHTDGVRLPDSELPEHWQAARSWSIVPVADELPVSLATRIPDTALVAVGWQGLLRTLERGARVQRREPRPDPVLGRANVVGLSRNDVGRDIPLTSLTGLLGDGARLAITDGAAGGEIVDVLAGLPAGRRAYPPISVPAEVDATGAGDTFLAAVLSAILTDGRGPVWPSDAQVRFATAAAAIVVSATGLQGVPADADAVRRLAGSAAPADD